MSLTCKNLYSRTNTYRLLPRDYFCFTFRFLSVKKCFTHRFSIREQTHTDFCLVTIFLLFLRFDSMNKCLFAMFVMSINDSGTVLEDVGFIYTFRDVKLCLQLKLNIFRYPN